MQGLADQYKGDFDACFGGFENFFIGGLTSVITEATPKTEYDAACRVCENRKFNPRIKLACKTEILFLAIHRGNIPLLNHILDNEKDNLEIFRPYLLGVGTPEYAGCSPLSLAVREIRVDSGCKKYQYIAQVLIARGAGFLSRSEQTQIFDILTKPFFLEEQTFPDGTLQLKNPHHKERISAQFEVLKHLIRRGDRWDQELNLLDYTQCKIYQKALEEVAREREIAVVFHKCVFFTEIDALRVLPRELLLYLAHFIPSSPFHEYHPVMVKPLPSLYD